MKKKGDCGEILLLCQQKYVNILNFELCSQLKKNP